MHAAVSMSAGGAFGGARGYQPRAPEKGVFPLDHFGECKSVRAGVLLTFIQPANTFRSGEAAFSQLKDAYLECLKANSHKAEACRALSKSYLECRMDR